MEDFTCGSSTHVGRSLTWVQNKSRKKIWGCGFPTKIKSPRTKARDIFVSLLRVTSSLLCLVLKVDREGESEHVLTHAPSLAVRWILAIGRPVAANWVAPDASSTLTCTLCVCACTTFPMKHTHTLLPKRRCNWQLWVPSSLGFRHKTLQKPAGSF